MINEFGHTNDVKYFEAANEFIAAAKSMQGNYQTSDIEYWVDEVEFCEVWK